MPGKRKVIATLSFELLLYSLAYVLCLFVAFGNIHAVSGSAGFLFISALILGPPLVAVVANGARMIRMARAANDRPERKDVMGFAIRLMAVQSLAVLLTPIAGLLALGLCVTLSFAGLIVAAGMRDSDPPPPPT